MSRQQKILSAEEVQKLVEGANEGEQETSQPNEFDVMLIKTCLGHGLRNMETVSLQRKHVTFDPPKVSIERENTKSDHGVRNVPTLDSIHNIEISKHFIDWVEKNTEKPDDFLFPSPRTNSHISERYFQKMMLRLAWNLGFYPYLSSIDMVEETVPEEKRVRPHALRHTYGTRSYENGVPPKELQTLMGHKKVEITMNLYAHLSNEKSRDLINEAAQNWD